MAKNLNSKTGENKRRKPPRQSNTIEFPGGYQIFCLYLLSVSDPGPKFLLMVWKKIKKYFTYPNFKHNFCENICCSKSSITDSDPAGSETMMWCSIYVMVLILDGRSEHVAHALRKLDLFSENNNSIFSRSNQILLNRPSIKDGSLHAQLFHSYHLI